MLKFRLHKAKFYLLYILNFNNKGFNFQKLSTTSEQQINTTNLLK